MLEILFNRDLITSFGRKIWKRMLKTINTYHRSRKRVMLEYMDAIGSKGDGNKVGVRGNADIALVSGEREVIPPYNGHPC
jgi:hypothetical protein